MKKEGALMEKKIKGSWKCGNNLYKMVSKAPVKERFVFNELMEFIKKYTGKIVRSKMKWYEKLDIALFTYNLPLTAIFAFFIFRHGLLSPPRIYRNDGNLRGT